MEPRVTSDLAAVAESERKCEAMAAALERGYEAYVAHLAEMERQRRQAFVRFWTIALAVVGGLVALLLFRSS